MSKHLTTICVEGNIASGKSTFLNGLNSDHDFHILSEPVSKWTNCGGHNLLELMYKNPKKWSFCFQSFVQLTMIQNHTSEMTGKRVRIMERSLLSSQHCFVENLRNQNYLSETEHSVLQEWYEFAKTNLRIRPDLIVYLRTDPKIAYERLLRRNRTEERSVTIDYLTNIHDLHEEWLINQQKCRPPCRVWIVDANSNKDDMRRSQLMLKQKIAELEQWEKDDEL